MMHYPTQPPHARVAAKYMKARETNDFTAVHAALKLFLSFEDAVRSGDIPKRSTQTIKATAKKIVDLLDIHFESDEVHARVAPGFLLGIAGVRLTLRQLAKAPLDQVPLVLKHLTYIEFWSDVADIGNALLDMIHNMDTDDEGHTTVGAYSVTLQSAADAEWDDEALILLHEILERTAGMLKRAGYGGHARGHVHAFPSEFVPPAIAGMPGVDAFYNHVADKFWLAVRGGHSDYVMVHETGHQVYFKDLPGNARSVWQDFFNENQGGVDLADIFPDWSKWIASARTTEDREKRSSVGGYIKRLQQKNPGKAMILEIVVNKFVRNRPAYMNGMPDDLNDLKLIKHLAPKIKTFMYPITAYSASSAEELFAEVFAHYVTKGPGSSAKVVRAVFEHIVNH